MDNNFNNDYGFDPITGQPINKPQEQPAIQNANMMNMNLQQPVGGMNQQIEQLNVQNSNTMGMNSQQPVGGMNQQIEQLNVQNSNTMDMNSQQPVGGMNQQIEQLNVQNSNTMDMNSQQPMGEINQQLSQPTIKPKQNFNKNIIVIIVLGIIAIIAGFLIYMSFSKNKLSNGDTNNNVDIENSNQDIEQDNTGNDFNNSNDKDTKDQLVIATMGHVDHGKSTLTSAITKIYGDYKTVDEINDALEARERGMTYKYSLVEYETAIRHYSHYDMPEHSDYIKTMIAGALELDGAILVVSAVDGPMPQTREHLILLQQSGITKIVVFMNKCDLVDDSKLLDLVETDIRELLDEYGFDGKNTPIIRGSALKAIEGDKKAEQSIKDLMAAVDSYIEIPESDTDKPFLMTVEDVFTISGRGTVVTGRVERGQLNLNDEVEIVGLRDTQKTVVTGIEMFRKSLDYAEAGDNAGILLRDISREQIERGQVLSKPGSVTPHKKFKARVYMLSNEEGGRLTPFFSNYRTQFYFRTTDVTGVIELPVGVEMVMPGDNTEMTVELISTIAIEKGTKFLIREGGHTVGFGNVFEIIE